MAKRRKKRRAVIRADDVLAALDDLADGLRGDVMSTALLAGAKIVQADAQKRAPEQSHELRNSIQVSAEGEGGLAVPKPRTDKETLVAIGSNAEHAHRIEYGFFGADSLGRTFSQEAKPFMRPALDKKRRAVIEAVEKSLREQLNLDGG